MNDLCTLNLWLDLCKSGYGIVTFLPLLPPPPSSTGVSLVLLTTPQRRCPPWLSATETPPPGCTTTCSSTMTLGVWGGGEVEGWGVPHSHPRRLLEPFILDFDMLLVNGHPVNSYSIAVSIAVLTAFPHSMDVQTLSHLYYTIEVYNVHPLSTMPHNISQYKYPVLLNFI